MSQSVTRLKELLFDSEAQALAGLSRRLDGLAELTASERQALTERIDALFQTVGDQERLTASISMVLSDALRRAEIHDHQQLARSVAPVVVSTIKAELLNSRDEMVEALYPITGQLVKAYVASAIKDLTEQMNRRLEQNTAMLRLQSIVSGRSMAELALAATQDFEVRELYLIRRGTGALLAQWPQRDPVSRDHALSGILAAINEFASEALAANGSGLRQIDLGDERVYLRASPLYLLAARCAGTAPKPVEQVIDQAFLTLIEKYAALSATVAPAPGGRALTTPDGDILAEAGTALQSRFSDARAKVQSSSGGTLRLATAVVLTPLLFWIAFSAYDAFERARAQNEARAIVAATPAMQGYPVTIKAERLARRVTVSGLAPSEGSRDSLVHQIRIALPGSVIRPALTVVPGSAPLPPDLSEDVARLDRSIVAFDGRLARMALSRDLKRAIRQLNNAAIDLQQSAEAAPAGATSNTAATSARALSSLQTALAKEADALSNLPVEQHVEQVGTRLAGLHIDVQEVRLRLERAAGTAKSADRATDQAAEDATIASSPAMIGMRILDDADRIATLSAALSLAARLTPPAPPPTVPAKSPRAALTELFDAKAIFFGDGLGYRDPAISSATLEAIATAIKTAGLAVRVVGHTDGSGTPAANLTLSLQRAAKVRDDLIGRGVPAKMLTSIGRADAVPIAGDDAPLNPNRRVTFELGFDGEMEP